MWAIKLLLPAFLQLHRSYAGYIIQTINVTLMQPDHPVYDPRTELLYFSDETKLYCYNTVKDKTSWIDLRGQVGPIVATKKDSGQVVVGVKGNLTLIVWDGIGTMKKDTTFGTVGEKNTQYNSGRADKKGRLWFATIDIANGTAAKNNGTLRYITKDNKSKNGSYIYHKWTKIRGFAFSADNKYVYYAHPEKYQIIKSDYDMDGKISHPEVSFDLIKQKGKSATDTEITGIATDTDDNIWVSLSNVGTVLKVNPKNGKILQEVLVPAPYVTNIGWGGKKMKTLYVTAFTHKVDFQLNFGKLYAITGLGAQGNEIFESDIA